MGREGRERWALRGESGGQGGARAVGREGRERWAGRGESGGQGGHFCPPPQLKNICPESEEGTKSFFIQNCLPRI